ncbi:sensor histidine kinase [Rhodospira trueperi]|uniref:histidine kinase n=1 Tax=Rhodospira trueperi TaxID=69960 RepID=A0A1G6Z9A7_9PROT|nr:PAS domain-containing sensor histidine kinase [Rhodospira trueperi]SDD99228.1 PAS domain S-box-containing protein [Rhodospira trueperi]
MSAPHLNGFLETRRRAANLGPAKRELLVFMVFGALGTLAAYVNVNLPHTDIFLSGRYAFGVMGFVLLRHWWTALLLATLLAAVGEHTLPLSTVFPINMALTVPMVVLLRALYQKVLAQTENTVQFGLVWIAAIMLYYQFVMVSIGGIESGRQQTPLGSSVLTFLAAQSHLVESVLVGVVSAAGLTMLRSYQIVARQRTELEVTLASIGDAVIVTDAKGTIRRVNPEAARLSGWKPEEAEGRPLSDVLHLVNSETRRPVPDPVSRVLSDGVTVGLANHTALIARDGQEHQIADSAAPIRDPSAIRAASPPLGVVMVFRDVTDTYRMQAALAFQKRNFDMAVAASGTGVWDWNVRTDRVVRAGNYAHLFGIDVHDTEGGPLSEDITALIHPEDRAPIPDKLQQALRSGTEYEHTFRVTRPDGRERWLRTRGQVIERDESGPIRMAGTTQDITDLQITLEALRRSNADLEQFAHVASHDLQEPVRSLVAYSQLLGRRYDHLLDPDGREFLGFIIGGAKRMQALVLDLLEYSRVSSRAKPSSSVDLATLVAEAIENLDQAIRDSGAHITVGDLPVVTGDKPQLLSLFQNLIANAIKFQRAGAAPEITISARRKTDAWDLTVADNGIGIDPAFQDRIFEPFKRLHTNDTFSGTGIGLAVAKRIVERHQGLIRVDSAPGEGSRFVVTLPDAPSPLEMETSGRQDMTGRHTTPNDSPD